MDVVDVAQRRPDASDDGTGRSDWSGVVDVDRLVVGGRDERRSASYQMPLPRAKTIVPDDLLSKLVAPTNWGPARSSRPPARRRRRTDLPACRCPVPDSRRVDRYRLPSTRSSVREICSFNRSTHAASCWRRRAPDRRRRPVAGRVAFPDAPALDLLTDSQVSDGVGPPAQSCSCWRGSLGADVLPRASKRIADAPRRRLRPPSWSRGSNRPGPRTSAVRPEPAGHEGGVRDRQAARAMTRDVEPCGSMIRWHRARAADRRPGAGLAGGAADASRQNAGPNVSEAAVTSPVWSRPRRVITDRASL